MRSNEQPRATRWGDGALALLNGLVGDHLGRTGNGLATAMACMDGGRPLALAPAALAAAHPAASARVVLLVHGLMCTEAVWRFRDVDATGAAPDYGTLLAADLGYTPLYLRYNTGLAIADNGAALAALLERLTAAWPQEMEELLLVGHSLGGLVIRSACVHAGDGAAWRRRVRRTVSIGTPHLGSPVERAGRWASGVLRAADGPYTRLVADVGDLRSDGIKDLGDADLRHDDRAHRGPGFRPAGWRHPVALPDGVAHCLIAGSSSRAGRLGALAETLVPVASATADDGSLAPAEVCVLGGIGHLELARHPAVYAHIRAWCEAA